MMAANQDGIEAEACILPFSSPNLTFPEVSWFLVWSQVVKKGCVPGHTVEALEPLRIVYDRPRM